MIVSETCELIMWNVMRVLRRRSVERKFFSEQTRQ